MTRRCHRCGVLCCVKLDGTIYKHRAPDKSVCGEHPAMFCVYCSHEDFRFIAAAPIQQIFRGINMTITCPGYKCRKCGEYYLTPEQINVLVRLCESQYARIKRAWQ